MNYEILKEMIDCLRQFEQEQAPGQQAGIADFANWLQRKLTPRKEDEIAKQLQGEWSSLEIELVKLVVYLYRYGKSYSKEILRDTPLITFDDFVYLVTIYRRGSINKSEIIENNIHEKTTGMEILRRMTEAGLIYQQDDPKDKRSKLLFITEKGKEVLFPVLSQMGKAAMIFSGNLLHEEKAQLFYLLNKLHLFHNPIFLDKKQAQLEDILASLQKN